MQWEAPLKKRLSEEGPPAASLGLVLPADEMRTLFLGIEMCALFFANKTASAEGDCVFGGLVLLGGWARRKVLL